MSDRYTSARTPHGTGYASLGRKTRAEMIEEYRSYYQHQLEQAEKALTVADEDIVVETYLGPWARKRRELVTE